MANTILIKKSAYNSTVAPSGTGVSSDLAYGELGWLNNNSGSTGKLYIGGKTSSSSSPAGETYPVDIQANIISAIPVATAAANDSIDQAGKAGFSSADFAVTGNGFTTIKAGGVTLGTQTTGNYVATAVAGAGIDVSGATGNVTVSIGTGEVVNAMIGDNEVGSEHYAAGSVDSTALGTNAVTTLKVNNGAITADKLSQVNTEEAVTQACIREGAVGTPELIDNSVTSGKIGNSQVDTLQLANSAVETAKINNGAVTGAKIETGVTLAGDVTISGALTVAGTTTSVNSTNLTVKDKNIICASDQSGNPLTAAGVSGAGLTVGTNGSAPKITWDNLDDTDYWNVSHSLKFTAKSATIDCGSY